MDWAEGIPKPLDGSFEVYRWALGQDDFSAAEAAGALGRTLDEGERVIANLLAMRLIRRTASGRYVPSNPSVAVNTLLPSAELEVLERQAELDHFREELRNAAEQFRESRFGIRGASGWGVVPDVVSVLALLREAAANCTIEVVSVQPGGPRSAQELHEAEERDRRMLARGVRMRVLYQHTARFDPNTREHAEKLITEGAEFRTAEALFGRLIIFDQATAFVPAPAAGPGAAAVVRDPALVGFLHSCFEQAWGGAKEFDTRRAAPDVIGDDLKVEIVKMLEAGAKDDAIARRLGLSVRTCRKHIGQLMQRFGATSRFQLGYAVREMRYDES
ncbi:LuxR C-terminal-related transcriptional regulator [Saccharothrix sp. Mg75]|uniref:helix-turn-helix transcriptional regulator n=1 Tax=Saccharothrix sp. Mg75 TaxID=3445357 RepID=UPI003EEFD66B